MFHEKSITDFFSLSFSALLAATFVHELNLCNFSCFAFAFRCHSLFRVSGVRFSLAFKKYFSQEMFFPTSVICDTKLFQTLLFGEFMVDLDLSYRRGSYFQSNGQCENNTHTHHIQWQKNKNKALELKSPHKCPQWKAHVCKCKTKRQCNQIWLATFRCEWCYT